MAGLPEHKRLLLGYPVNMVTPPEAFFAWRRELALVGLDQFAFNNVGDPYEHSHIEFNSHAFERELITRFAALYRFSADDTWGFLSNSGTDSNMHGLYMGRKLLTGRAGVPPKIYFTAEAHYSIQILADLLGLERVEVGTEVDGRMSADSLGLSLAEHADHPALVVATVGTTFKGAVDSVDEIQAALIGREAYLHVDAALFGGYLPHTAFADELAQRAGGASRYDSIAVSCHKFFGFPSPAGIYICTRAAFDEFRAHFSQVHNPEYLLQVPGTITCSRDAVKPAEFWFFSSREAFARQRADAKQILSDASYLYGAMKTRFPELEPIRANALSNTVYFKKPSDEVVSTYTLATMKLRRDGAQVPYAHVVVMPHATRAVLDQFLSDLGRAG
ncbi:Histidine decarboxylase [Enhygromyxa salina]|uniref:Histidine decarboxylase n=1 Tax=Enhygromyxa salina TaxID=215803 RepID=A0A2S9XJM7_9BACT|nr:pyridoxal-dependent decarboxylase [Enhygromyxa salina]PRP93078.1 Histidine decarboxylase [Enhygromyxa salina]